MGELLCGSWGNDATDAVWRLVRDRWPMILAAVAALIGVRIGWTWWRRHIWRRHAAAARWLEITPPVTATPAATVGLWRLLATVLPAPRRWALRPARLVWEVAADPEGMRCGLWLPPGVNPTAVVRLLQRGWPGARAEQTRPPAVPTTGAVVTLAVWPTQPEWLPLVENTTSAPRRGVDAGAPEEDRLRAVYGGLASAGRTGAAILQVHLGRAPAHRLRVLRRAMTNPQRARRPRGASRAVGLLADGLHMLIIGVLNIFTPSPSSPKRRSNPTDPYTAELARQARAKYADAPHLLVAVRTVAAGPTKAAARAAAADVSSGFGLLSAHFTRRRLRRGAVAAADRWMSEARMSLVSVVEAAALAGLPAEPAVYGLPGAASRRRAATRDIFRTSGGVITRRSATQAESGATENDDSPTAWSSP
ncbi:hypothetical protein [Verrucosispora sioxanthis]|uniref:Type VI secretion protein n=1 Tax=Verrucosispora sioxanthis TaxID=2499994 RepID=A0A6M1L7N3_9ACTN|nr:hypothetical protein [Verrucosispora sioxanthis]NEE65136.1 hypothetical protein [Verrucosispora sioxanthis]NGM14246.1 hypothetical protein [Verrucosispora sioxanthis]